MVRRASVCSLWQVVSYALVGPIMRVDLVIRFFLAGLDHFYCGHRAGIDLLDAGSGLSLPPPGTRQRFEMPFSFEFTAIFALALAFTVAVIALTVRALVRWHHHFAIGEPDGGLVEERQGRARHYSSNGSRSASASP